MRLYLNCGHRANCHSKFMHCVKTRLQIVMKSSIDVKKNHVLRRTEERQMIIVTTLQLSHKRLDRLTLMHYSVN